MEKEGEKQRKNFSAWKILKHYWFFAKKYWYLFLSVFIFWGVGTFLFNIVAPLYYKDITNAVFSGDQQLVFSYLVPLLLTMVGYTVLFRIGDWSQVYFESRVIRNLYKHALSRLTENSYGFFSSHFIGSVVAKIKRYTRSFEMIQDTISFQLWFSFVQIVSVLVISFREDVRIGYFYLGWFMLFVTVVILFIPKRIRLDLNASENDSKIGGQISDILTNIMAVKTFAHRNRELGHFNGVADAYAKSLLRVWNYGNIQNTVQSILLLILAFGSIGLAVYLWSIGDITPGVIVLVFTFSGRLYDRFWDFARAITKIMTSFTDAHEAIELIENPIDVLDPKNPQKLNVRDGEVLLKNITFKYQNGVAVFEDLNFKLRSGERVGIVGHSGAGKSTLVKLLLRLTDVDSGSITIDGQDIRNVTQDDLRSHITYVPQEPLLFHRTISENIGYGKDNPTDEEIISASKKAYAHDFIMRLPEGYNTLVGERGVKLSGGERQRVALARAFLKDAPILILDEATSSLDSESEHYIQESLKVLLSGKTALIIAHRLSTIQSCDRIVVFEDGKIIEDGTHEELLKNGHVYHDLWSRQAGGFIKDEDE